MHLRRLVPGRLTRAQRCRSNTARPRIRRSKDGHRLCRHVHFSERLTVQCLSNTVKRMLNDRSTDTDRVFHALADANRRAIIHRLTRSPTTVSELARLLGVTVAAAVQHLQVLQASELVRSEKVGRVRTCQIDPSGLRRAEEWLHLQRTTWDRRLDRLEDVLSESSPHHDTTPDDPAKEPTS